VSGERHAGAVTRKDLFFSRRIGSYDPSSGTSELRAHRQLRLLASRDGPDDVILILIFRLTVSIWWHGSGLPCPIQGFISVLLTSLVAAAWRLSYERITDWLARYDAMAESLGYDEFNESGRRRTISLSQYSRRLRSLGLLPYFLIFIALVAVLLRMGLIKGWGLIIDSSLLAAWYHDDPDAAWSWPSRWKGRVFGYKVHTILCRWSYLSLFFVVTPANCNNGPLAIPMFAAVVLLYHLRISAVWADAAYFNYAFLGFVHNVLHASVNVDYNLRRQGKRFLATLFFIRQWRDLMSPRANIERHFTWMKRYFGLKYFRVQGYLAVTQFVFRVYIATLIVAFIATRYQRPELATSLLKVLAFVST
jgi:hypothetical protein